MNELTKAATEDKQQMGLPSNWPVLGMLGILSVSSVGGYGQLSSLADHVAETNRLAEARGATAAQVDTLRNEVEKLRLAVASAQTSEEARETFKIVKDAMTSLGQRLDGKADRAIMLDYIASARNKFETITAELAGVVTQGQFDVLVGRVDAISRRTREDAPEER